MKKKEKAILTIDVSVLEPQQRELIKAQVKRYQRYINDLALIQEKFPNIAANLNNSIGSKQAAVFAESEIIAQKIRKGTLTMLAASPKSTDAYYIQEKIGGMYVRLEIKSNTRKNAGTIDQEIMNAEVQHRSRLEEEGNDPTWHKTTIVVGNPNNAWPCASPEELELFKGKEDKLLELAEQHIEKLILGNIKPQKKMKALPSKINTRLEDAADSRSSQHANAPKPQALQQSTMPLPKSSTQATRPHLPEPASIQQSSAKKESKFKLTSPHTPTTKASRPLPPGPVQSPIDKPPITPTRATRPLPPDAPAITNPPINLEKQSSRILRARKPHQVAKQDASLTPASSKVQGRRQQVEAAATKAAKFDPQEKVLRELLVTEQITIVCPHRNMTIVLNRTEGKFVAHFKTDNTPKDYAKHERRHWDLPIHVRNWRPREKDEGNSPLHLAVLNQDPQSIKSFMKKNQLEYLNKDGLAPLHLAIAKGNLKIIELFTQKPESIDIQNSEGNTALHLACLARNHEVVRLLIDSGAKLDTVNKQGITPRALIEESNDLNMQQLIDKFNTLGL